MMMMGSTRRVVRHIIQPTTHNPSKPRPWWDMLATHNPKALISNWPKPKKVDSDEDPLIAGDQLPSDGNNEVVVVPKGFLAVYVGAELRRFVIPATYLSMPDFAVLMDRAAEEFGYSQEGGLRIPCEEDEFEDIISRCLAMQQPVAKTKHKKD